MLRVTKWILACVLAALLLGGCGARTVDQMYCLPKRSEDYNNLQTAIEKAMGDMEYCAPLTGENQQTVQMADLDGDSIQEYLVFAKGAAEKPLHILIFRQEGESYVLSQTIESYGTAFDQVEYVTADGSGNVLLAVGSQLSDQVLRSMTVYTFHDGQAEKLLTTNYTKFLTCDLNEDTFREIMVIRPGQTETDKGIAELYHMTGGSLERSNEVNMSEPADRMKRIVTGKLHGGRQAVYVASAVDENAIITDVFALVKGVFTNVSFSNESGTSVKTLRNYYVYADDIDNDGVVELPSLITMPPMENLPSAERQYLIRWYAMASDGSEVDKLYTYHNFAGGWYLVLDPSWAERMTVVQVGGGYECYLWNETLTEAKKLLSFFTFTGQNRDEMSISDGRFVLYKTDTTIYCASLEPEAAQIGMTRESLSESFHMIYRDWNTGET